jgi:repressor LexA
VTPLTDRQREALNIIITLVEQRGYPPTIAEISDYLGTTSTSTAYSHVRALERKGYIKIGFGARAITVLRDAS